MNYDIMLLFFVLLLMVGCELYTNILIKKENK